jgi:uncharacterized protein
MNPVVHFEMSYEDASRMARFYEAAFGWKTQQLGEKMGNYVLARTSESDEHGLPRERGMINGGFYARSGEHPPEPSVVIAVTDVKDALRRVREAGGNVHGDVIEIPGIGLYGAFSDTEGNRVGILQPDPME